LQVSRREARDSFNKAKAVEDADAYDSPPARRGRQLLCCGCFTYRSGYFYAAESFPRRKSRAAVATTASLAPRTAWITRDRCGGVVPPRVVHNFASEVHRCVLVRKVSGATWLKVERVCIYIRIGTVV